MVLVTGASGYLGRRVVRHLREAGRACVGTCFSTSPGELATERLDLRRRADVAALVERVRPHAVIHCAGSDRGEEVREAIVGGTRNLVDALHGTNTRLLVLSTDVVFDGRDGPYTETDRPNPLHEYGRAKVEAEAIAAEHPGAVAVRSSLIYDLDEMDHATAGMTARLRAGETLQLYTDELRSPVWRRSLCQACLALVDSDFAGPIHVGGDDALSRAEYARKLFAWWQVDCTDRVLEVPAANPVRPRDCRLDTTLARRILSVPLPGVDAVLATAHA